MNAMSQATGQNAFSMLRGFARRRLQTETCEFCGAPLAATHRHLLEVASRKLVCACDPCALRFENVIGRWKLIPRDARPLPDFQITDAQWEALALPINLAFLFHCTPVGRVLAMYPSPAGATESLLPLACWRELVEANPVLTRMAPDVEALLVNRLGEAREYYIAPMDACYELAGIIRVHWRGLTGGDKVLQELARFFERMSGSLPKVPSPAAQQTATTHA